MNQEIIENIRSKYLKIGFEEGSSSEDMLVFENKFSVHCIFLCNNIQEAEIRQEHYESEFQKIYFRSNYPEDIYWNFYCVYIIESCENNESFRIFKEKIENNIQLSRKSVYKSDHIELLPPFHLTVENKSAKTKEDLWEDQWMTAIGSELYERLNNTSKTRIEEMLSEYLDDEINKNYKN